MNGAALNEGVAYLPYRVRWRAGDPHPGRHASRQSGGGGDFRAFRAFWQLPDARRIDVRRSIVDPFEDVVVRELEQRSSIALVVAADLSRSMQAAAGGSSLAGVVALADAASRSALRAGDSFGLLGFDEAVREDVSIRPTRARGAAAEAVAALRRLRPTGRSAAGVRDLAARLPHRRCLVLLASDFLMPLEWLEPALAAMAAHDVVPIVLRDARAASLPRTGLLRLRDAESGGTRLVLMRPALHRRWIAEAAARQRALEAIFLRHARAPFHAEGTLDVAALGEHLRAV